MLEPLYEAELSRRPKGDVEKIGMAQGLRRETSVTLKWIAARLRMGSWSHVSNLLSAARKVECKK
ncbi:MAG TPA: hypothetical protein VFT34_02380 [Verrucomicrobiae bacterium]|nr:hypothetical protein [Verrucomicrobiae bacterium]